MPTLREQKKAVRTFALAARDGISLAERAAGSAAILERLAALPEVAAARSILCFAAFGSEVATTALMRWVLASHKVLAVPLIIGPEHMESRRVSDPERDLASGHWQIPEPDPSLPELSPESLDVVIVPGSGRSVRTEAASATGRLLRRVSRARPSGMARGRRLRRASPDARAAVGPRPAHGCDRHGESRAAAAAWAGGAHRRLSAAKPTCRAPCAAPRRAARRSDAPRPRAARRRRRPRPCPRTRSARGA